MENKTGRKYNRKKWNWCGLEDGKYDDVKSKYDEHPYYDSPKRKKNEEAFFWFITIAGGCVVGMILGGLVIKLIF